MGVRDEFIEKHNGILYDDGGRPIKVVFPTGPGAVRVVSDQFPLTMTEAVYAEKPYRLRPRLIAGALLVPPQSIIDGVSELDFVPATLFCELTSGSGLDESPGNLTPPSGGAVAGNIALQMRGIERSGGWYLRRFTLSRFRMIEIDISTFADVQLEVLRSTAIGADLVCTVTNRVFGTNRAEVLHYAETYTGAATYLVPPGAARLFPAVTDVNFAWTTDDTQTGAAVLTPEPAFVGVEIVPKGTHFVTTVAVFRAAWRVTL